MLNPLKEFIRWVCVGLSVKDKIKEYVRVYEHHRRYFFTNAS